MARILSQRLTAEVDGEFIVFLIGMRFNRPWKVHRWLPVILAMFRMIREVSSAKNIGFLGVEFWLGSTGPMLQQYWRSFELLECYAKSKEREHRPAWLSFNKAIASSGDVGIWHETYRVRPGDYECVYNNMPLFGLAKATKAVPATAGRESASGRMGVGHVRQEG